MTLNLSNRVSISTTVQDAIVKAANFGVPAVFAYHTNYVGWKTYAADPDGLAEMVTDGFGVFHDAYLKVAAIAAQSPGTPNVKVYARTTNDLQSITLTPVTTTEGSVYTFDVNGTSISYTVLGSATAASIATALQPLIDAATGVTAVDATGAVTITPDDRAVATVYIDGGGADFTLADAATDAGIATDFAAAVALDNGFYGVLTDAYSDGGINAMGALAEVNGKLYLALGADSDIPSASSTDVASDLQTSAYHRTALLPTRDMSGQLASGLMGRQFAFNPGESNWNWQAPALASADNWTQAEYGFIIGKDAGVYADFAPTGADPTGITAEVKAASGRFLDVTRGTDWLESNLGSAIATEMAAQEKVPNNSEGRGMIEKAMSAVFKQGERFGFVEDDWTITIPSKAQQSAVDKAARYLNEVKFTATIQGAIDTVTVAGTLTL